VTTNCESPLISEKRLKPAVRYMEKMNISEKNLNQNMIVIEEAKAVTMNDALTRVLVHYHKFAPLNVR
jgi:hypothetical protein